MDEVEDNKEEGKTGLNSTITHNHCMAESNDDSAGLSTKQNVEDEVQNHKTRSYLIEDENKDRTPNGLTHRDGSRSKNVNFDDRSNFCICHLEEGDGALTSDVATSESSPSGVKSEFDSDNKMSHELEGLLGSPADGFVRCSVPSESGNKSESEEDRKLVPSSSNNSKTMHAFKNKSYDKPARKSSMRKYRNAMQHAIPIRPKSVDEFCPSERAGLFSYMSFQWIQPLLLRIRKRGIDASKMWKIPRAQSAEINADRLERLWCRELNGRGSQDANFFRVLLRFVKTRMILAGVLLLLHVLISFISPAIVIRLMLEYCQGREENVPYGVGLAFILVFAELCRSLSLNLLWALNYETGTRVRAATMTLLYKKVLKLRSLKDKSAGKLLNLFSADGFRLMESTINGINVISGPFSSVVSLVYLLFLIGPAAVVGYVVFFLFYPFQVVLSNLWSKYRSQLVVLTDHRIRLMNEILTCVKLIKMYAWEVPFSHTVSKYRKAELKVLKKAVFVQSMSKAFIPSMPTIAAILTVITHTLIGNNLTAAEAFTLLAVLNTVRPKINLIPSSTKAIAEARVAAKRFQDVLMMEELDELGSELKSADDSKDAVVFQEATFGWDAQTPNGNETDQSKKTGTPAKRTKKTNSNGAELQYLNQSITDRDSYTPVLFELDFVIPKGQLVGICGVVGSGKSSLISAILKQAHQLGGRMHVNGTVAYVAQQAWIINSTVKENIIFGSKFDKNRYAQCLHSCNLLPDLALLPASDETEIGERGVTLSGGQKQRISLARAVYSDNDIYLLDDPLAAVDSPVGNHIFQHCVKKLLKNKTILFVTHHIHYLQQCDRIMYLKNGRITEVGTHHELMSSECGDYAGIMSTYKDNSQRSTSNSSCEEIDSGVVIGLEGWKSRSAQNLSVMTRFRQRISSISLPDITADERHYENPFLSSTSINSIASDTEAENTSTDVKFNRVEEYLEVNDGKLIKTEEKMTGSIRSSTYLIYINAAGGACVAASVMFIFAVSIAGSGVSNWWLSYWISQGSGNTSIIVDNVTVISDNISDNPSMWFYNSVHGAILVALLVFTCLRAFTFMHATIAASNNVHDRVFADVLRSPMTFFDTTPVGRIINRFSKDIDEVDCGLPIIMESLIQNMLMVLLAIAMISLVFPWFLLAVAPLGVVFIVLQRVFRVGIRELKRHDAVTMSPLYSFVTTTVQGLVTIRAYRKQDDYYRRFNELVDMNSMPLFLFHSAKRWLTVRLDLLANVIIFCTGLMVVLLKSSIQPAYAGLAISYAIQMTGLFQYATRVAVDTESKFTSVERMEEYMKLAREESSGSKSTSDAADWPSTGRIEFDSVKLRYRPGLSLALKGVSFDVRSMEKLGIVGRTGSGKSSLGVALFRLVELNAGTITIDGVDIAKVSLKELRSRLSIIPQDPVLFVGTVRYNLDPFAERTDADIWSALDKCYITEMVKGLPKQLDSLVVENGENFSVGERQLICLVRALLRKSKILMLDEATASIDTETDALIQRTIAESFRDCTILTIAHRLNTILNYDRVLVLKKGKVVEFDKPSTLLSNPKSVFSNMWEASDLKVVSSSSS
ncbi:ATP-binding cassette sub-family C member 5-like isoform X2 [Tubulanus polymorphus]|uniref:ATP-binding cassette sub-family C member 5-like isoform X2 n=1 Tax=Tubulanus polymorphus TaxID=672921 RepID=UPI003DA6C546